MPEGETEETCKEHIKAMQKEMARSSNKNLATVKELMAVTHAYRRELFLKETISIKQFIEDYPALKTSAEVCFAAFIVQTNKRFLVSRSTKDLKNTPQG